MHAHMLLTRTHDAEGRQRRTDGVQCMPDVHTQCSQAHLIDTYTLTRLLTDLLRCIGAAISSHDLARAHSPDQKMGKGGQQLLL